MPPRPNSFVTFYRTLFRMLKQVLLFPIDLIYLTIDSWLIGVRYVRSLVLREKDQRCHFCRGDDHREAGHPVRAALKYQNLWLVRLVSPCIRTKPGKSRQVPVCMREGGYTKATPLAPLMALGMTAFWFFGTYGVLRSLSSEPEHFWTNPITFMNPARTEGRRETETDFLELQTGRINRDAAQRYFEQGMRFLDQRRFSNAQVDFRISLQHNPYDPETHYQLARVYYATGQGRDGENSVRRALDLNPEHVPALLIMTEVLESRERHGEALTYAARALELEPENARALRLNTSLRINTGNLEGARETLSRLMAVDGQNPDTLAFAGRVQLLAYNDTAQGEALLRQALERDADHVEALMGMTLLHRHAQDVQALEATLNRVLEINPDHLQARQTHADLILSRFGVQAGLRAYGELMEQFGQQHGVRLRYAELLIQGGRVSEGRRMLDQLTTSRVPAVERAAHWTLARMYAQLRMMDEATDHAQRALSRAEGNLDIQVFLAQLYLNNQKPADALRVTSQAMRRHPNDINVIRLYTQALVALGDWDEALAYLDERLAAEPENDQLRVRRMEVLMFTPRWEESVADSRYLLEKYPDVPQLQHNLAFTLARAGKNLDEAYELASTLVAERGQDPGILDTYGYVLMAQGKYEEALEYFVKAARASGGDLTIRLHLAQCLVHLGRVDEAKMHLQGILLTNPDFHQAEEARALYEQLQQQPPQSQSQPQGGV